MSLSPSPLVTISIILASVLHLGLFEMIVPDVMLLFFAVCERVRKDGCREDSDSDTVISEVLRLRLLDF